MENRFATQRKVALDILKCIACVCVIFIHTAAEGMQTAEIGSFNWYCAVFWGSISRFAVPIFFMVTGALLLNPAKEMGIKKIFSHYFLRILACLFFWAALYELFLIGGNYILYDDFTIGYFVNSLKNLLLFNHHFQLYYLHMLLMFYVLLPAIRAIVKGASRNELRYILIVWFVVGVCLSFLYEFKPFSFLDGIPSQYPISITYAAPGYGLLGYYIKTAKFERKDFGKYLTAFIIGFLITFIGTSAFSIHQGTLYESLISGFSPGVAFMAIGIFGVIHILCIDKGGKNTLRITRFSKASFCVYLVHHFFIMIMLILIPTAFTSTCIISIPVLSIVTLTASLAVCWVLKKIPVVNKYLI